MTSATSDPLRSPTPPLAPRPLIRWLWRLTKDVVKDYQRDGAGDLAAAITFWTVLSIPAAVLALISTLSSLDSIAGSNVADDLRTRTLDFIADQFVNSSALTGAVEELFDTRSPGVATVATLVALFTLSRAFAGLIRALDDAYEVVDGRRWWHARLVAMGLGIGTVVVVAGAAVLLAFLPALGLGAFAGWVAVLIVLTSLTMWAATLYHVGPNHRTPWRYDVPGAIVTALGWAASTQLFASYIRLSGSGNQLQSTVGAVLVALTLLYVLSLVMIVGAEINDVISRRAGVVQVPRSTEMIDRTVERVREQVARRLNAVRVPGLDDGTDPSAPSDDAPVESAEAEPAD